jgi:hypothetical protein
MRLQVYIRPVLQAVACGNVHQSLGRIDTLTELVACNN